MGNHNICSALGMSKRVEVPLVVVTRPADTKGWMGTHTTCPALSFWGSPMPQKFLSIKNLEKYQTNRKLNPPWFKLHRIMFGDPEFIKLTPSQRFLYIGLIHLAVESGNRIYNDSTFIGQRLYIPHTEVDLKPLYRAGFLYTSNLSRVLSETEESRDRVEGEESAIIPDIVETKTKGKRAIRDEDRPTEKHITFAKTLGIDPGPEWGKFKNYCLAHDKRYANFEAAFRNWLANAKDMKGGGR